MKLTATRTVTIFTALLCAALMLAATSGTFAQSVAQKEYPESATYQGRSGCDVSTFFGTDNVACYHGAYYVIDGTQLRMLNENMQQVEAVRYYNDRMYEEDAERLGDAYGGISADAVDEARLMVNNEGVFVMHAGRVHRFDHTLNRVDTDVLFDSPRRFRRDDRRFDKRRGRYGPGYRTPEYYYPPGYNYNPRPPGTYYYDDRDDPRRGTPPGWYDPPGTGTPPGYYNPPRRPGWYRAPGQGNNPGWYNREPTPPGWYESPEERREQERRERHRNNPFRW